jgi:hypothetical protein
MASETSICNRTLQKLGAKRINSLTEDSPNARSCNTAYEARRDALLRKHRWRFSIKRAQLAASTTEPDFGPAAIYPLPADYLLLIDPDPESNFNDRDWQLESDGIHSDASAPLEIRYVAKITDPNAMDPLFREALSADMAVELCEEITQSNTKKASLVEDLKDALAAAKRANAFESIAQDSPEDTWISVRD